MSIALRNLEEADLQATQALLSAQAGDDLAKTPYLQLDHLRSLVLVDTVFGLVAEEDGTIQGTASVLMEQESPQTVVGLLCRLCVPNVPARPEIAVNLAATALQSLEGNLQICVA